MSRFQVGGFQKAVASSQGLRQFEDIVSNLTSMRSQLFQQLFDPRRDIDDECGYPRTELGQGIGQQIPVDLYRNLYDRESVATRVVQVLPKESWRVQPNVYEVDDPDTETPFEQAWDGLTRSLYGTGGKSWYQDSDGSQIWEHLKRVDTVSRIGSYGLLLYIIDDGLPLDQPAQGVVSYTPEGDGLGGSTHNLTANVQADETLLANSSQYTLNELASNVSLPAVHPSLRARLSLTSMGHGRRGPEWDIIQTQAIYEAEKSYLTNRQEVWNSAVQRARASVSSEGLRFLDSTPRYSEVGRRMGPRDAGYHHNRTDPSVRARTIDGNDPFAPFAVNELPARYRETANPRGVHEDQSSPEDQGAPGGTHEMGGSPMSLRGGAVGTDAQYVGIQLSPPEYPSTKPSTQPRKLLALRSFDESLVQVTQYEANVRNPRFGQPVMYRVTLNDPRQQHSGIGLPMATVRIHWSRVLHVNDVEANQVPSEIFSPPVMQPVLNRLLDLRKLYSGSAEMYWRGAFPGISLETNPALGGDVEVDVSGIQSDMEQYFNGLQRYLLLMGMSAKTLAPTVVDPTPQIETQIKAICIQIGIPVPVFAGYEIGEQASSNNAEDWADRLKERQHSYLTPRIIIPFIDRLIQMGVLPEPKGYSIEWPDIESNSEAEKSAIALQRTQSLAAYVSGNVESMMSPLSYLTQILGMDEDAAQAIIEETQQAHEDEDTLTAPPMVGGRPAAAQPGTQDHKDSQDAAKQLQATLETKSGPSPTSPAGAKASLPKAPKPATPAGNSLTNSLAPSHDIYSDLFPSVYVVQESDLL